MGGKSYMERGSKIVCVIYERLPTLVVTLGTIRTSHYKLNSIMDMTTFA